MTETQKQDVLEPWQKEILEYYLDNYYAKLRVIVKKLLLPIGGITQKDEDDFISNSAYLIYTKLLNSYDKTSNIPFHKYLETCLEKKFITWGIRDKNRQKNKNMIKKKDESGNYILDDKGNFEYEIVSDVSFDAPIGDSDFTLKDVIKDSAIKEEMPSNVENYLASLSETQKKIAELVIKKHSPQEIREELNMSEVKFKKLLLDMKSFDKEIIIKHRDAIVEEDNQMETNVTFEKSKTNRLSISSLKKKITSQTIRFNHSLQRPSDQWTSAMKGNLVSDILQGNPINPLIFAEEVINGIPIIWDLDGKQRCINAYDYSKDKFKVSKKVRRSNIAYTYILKDENGRQILDENGFPQSEIREFDITNKKFSQLPEELQEKFLDYNFEIVQYINCSKEDIAYHIARYNEGKPMSVNHKGIIRLGEEFASTIKSISVMPFFKEQGGYTVSEAKGTNGTINRVVVESVMAANYLSDWKKTQEEACEYLRENATPEVFDNFEDMVDRISNIGTEETLQMFDSKDSFLYFGLFARFCNTGLDDGKFIEFMAEFSQSLHNKEINGVTFDSLCVNKDGKTTSNKDRLVAIGKINMLEKLMLDYLHINIKEIQPEEVVTEETSTLDFVRENVGQVLDVDEDGNKFTRDIADDDIELYREDFELFTVDIDGIINSKLMDKSNEPSVLSLIAYGYKEDKQLDEWFNYYFSRNDNYIHNQKQNFLHMKESLDKYVEKMENSKLPTIMMNGGKMACATQR